MSDIRTVTIPQAFQIALQHHHAGRLEAAEGIMDARRFARNVEAAFRSMWERWRLAAV
jgi:hypothetical protein